MTKPKTAPRRITATPATRPQAEPTSLTPDQQIIADAFADYDEACAKVTATAQDVLAAKSLCESARVAVEAAQDANANAKTEASRARTALSKELGHRFKVGTVLKRGEQLYVVDGGAGLVALATPIAV